jgi:hypothetical protein
LSKNPKNKFGERKGALAGMDIKKKNKKNSEKRSECALRLCKGGGGGLNA